MDILVIGFLIKVLKNLTDTWSRADLVIRSIKDVCNTNDLYKLPIFVLVNRYSIY